MPQNNELIEKPRLGFFQRIRKAILLRRINPDRYAKAPDYLKNDNDVVDALIRKSPMHMRLLGLSQKLRVINENPNLMNRIPEREQDILLAEKPELIANLQERTALTKILTQDKSERLIKYLSKELQKKLLMEEISYIPPSRGPRKFDSKFEMRTSEPDKFADKLEYFSPEVVEEAVIELVEKAKNGRKNTYDSWKDMRQRVPLLAKMKISSLPIDLQLKLGLMDNEFIHKMSPEALEKFVGDNPMLIGMLPEEKQVEMIKKNPEFLKAFPYNKKLELAAKAEEKYYSPNEKLKAIIKDVDGAKKYLTGTIGSYNASSLTDVFRDRESLIELARFEPRVLSTIGLYDNAAYRKTAHVNELFKSMTTNPEIQQAIDDAYRKMLPHMGNLVETSRILEDLAKVLLNERIMSTCDPKLIAEYIKNPNFDNMLNVAAQTYGEDVKGIFADRPLVNTDQIQNMDIFDKRVREKFGNDIVHHLISYNSRASSIIGELIRHPEKMEQYELFERATDGYFENTIVDLDSKLYTFEMLSGVMSSIAEEDLTPEVMDTLKLVANDYMMMSQNEANYGNELATIPLNNLEDLKDYKKRRNEIYRDYALKTNSPEELKEAISKRFFGMTYNQGIRGNYSPEAISVVKMIHYYNLESFVSDERTVESGNFSEDELDILELLTIISKVKDPKVLKQIYTKLEEKEDMLSPTDFKAIREKIPMQYSKELVDSLLTPEDARKRAESGEQGIAYRKTENGHEVITLNGADFRIMLHTFGMNNSGVQIPYQADVEETWKYFENGCSTISSCVIEPEMLHSCASAGKVNFGFSSVPAKQVIGMSPYDAHVSHGIRRLNPEFEFGMVRFDYPDELMRKTAAQISGIEQKDSRHEYNEATMYRRDITLGTDKTGTYGGKIMPDYIVVYGKSNAYHEMLADKFAKDGKPIPIIEIDKGAYYDRTYVRGLRREEHSVDRKSGKMVNEIKELATPKNDDGR